MERGRLALVQVSSGLGSDFWKPFPAGHPLISRKFPGNLLSILLPRLQTSGIEYVILVGSSLFTLSGAQCQYGSGLASSWWRTVRDFFNDLDFFALENANFRSPAGASLGSEGSQPPSTRTKASATPLFPGKFPESENLTDPLISRGISRNLYQGQTRPFCWVGGCWVGRLRRRRLRARSPRVAVYTEGF